MGAGNLSSYGSNIALTSVPLEFPILSLLASERPLPFNGTVMLKTGKYIIMHFLVVSCKRQDVLSSEFYSQGFLKCQCLLPAS